MQISFDNCRSTPVFLRLRRGNNQPATVLATQAMVSELICQVSSTCPQLDKIAKDLLVLAAVQSPSPVPLMQAMKGPVTLTKEASMVRQQAACMAKQHTTSTVRVLAGGGMGVQQGGGMAAQQEESMAVQLPAAMAMLAMAQQPGVVMGPVPTTAILRQQCMGVGVAMGEMQGMRQPAVTAIMTIAAPAPSTEG